MSKRITRINELLQREISEQLRLRYRNEAVAITVSEVAITADLRQAKVFYSVLGDAAAVAAAGRLFRRIGPDLSQRVSRRVILKYFPKLEFVYDESLERGARILEIMDELEEDNG